MNAAELASGCRAAGIDEPTAAVSLAMRPHQQAAFDEAVRHLGEHARVTIALPCGTGKTLLGQRLAQHLGPAWALGDSGVGAVGGAAGADDAGLDPAPPSAVGGVRVLSRPQRVQHGFACSGVD